MKSLYQLSVLCVLLADLGMSAVLFSLRQAEFACMANLLLSLQLFVSISGPALGSK